MSYRCRSIDHANICAACHADKSSKTRAGSKHYYNTSCLEIKTTIYDDIMISLWHYTFSRKKTAAHMDRVRVNPSFVTTRLLWLNFLYAVFGYHGGYMYVFEIYNSNTYCAQTNETNTYQIFRRTRELFGRICEKSSRREPGFACITKGW